MLINLYNQGQLQQALEQSVKLLEKYPESAVLFNIQGALFQGLRQFDLSQEAYGKAIAIKPDFAESFYNMGNAFRDQGDLKSAIAAYSKALVIKPDYAEAYIHMGNALKEQENLNEAINAYENALSINSKYYEAYNNMGLALYDQGKPEKAVIAYSNALSINPNDAEAYNNMGLALYDQGKLEEATAAYNKALSIKPDYADAYNNMGVTLKDQGKIIDAMEAYTRALSIVPDYAEAYYNIGIILKEQDKLEEAIEAYKKAFSINPDYADAYNNMGVTLKDQGKLDEAIEAYNKALSTKPDYAEAYNNMGVTLKDQGNLDEAMEAYNKALSIKPDYAEAFNNVGTALTEQGKLEEATEAYNKAISVQPDYAEAHQNLSFVLLNNGRLKEGLDEYEWRWKTAKGLSTIRHFSQPLWDGKKSLKGKTILIWSEQGVGDTINWSFCISLVASQAAHCILECQQKLVPLLARSLPNVEVKPENKSFDLQRNDFDFHLPTGSLYRHFISTISQASKAEEFLIPDPLRVKFWRERLNSLGKGPYIGISWKSSIMTPARLPNYASISDLSPVIKIPDVTFINMQYRDFADDLAKIKDELGVKVHNFDDLDQFENLEDVAALCAALDFVVSTHNALLLIAPRVGTPTKFASWRQSPWNNVLRAPKGPSLDLFERNTWEPWDQVFKLIAKDIMKKKRIVK